MTFGMTLAEHLTMATSAGMFYITINYEYELNMKVPASSVNIKIHQLFSKQRVLGVRVTIAQRKTSGGLTRTGFLKRVDHTCDNDHKTDLDLFK